MWMNGCGLALASALVLSACHWPEKAVRPSKDTYSPTPLTVRVADVSETVAGATVRPDFFKGDGLQPLLGRFFVEPEYSGAPTAVAVISHRYWTSRFRSDPSVIGSRIDVNGRPTVIVGVAHPRFQPEGAAMIWIPEVR
jgi:putative ABC transport system permease protein